MAASFKQAGNKFNKGAKPQQQQRDDNTKLITGMWIQKSKDGQTTYMSGIVKDKNIKYLLFKNRKKENDTDPDYHLVVQDYTVEQKPAFNPNKKQAAPVESFDEEPQAEQEEEFEGAPF
jgi:hypothetical protein